ncbi:MAG: HypC/HybG/HupF family hydrogenase formation chaperone, partial [Candidatus Obscuribacterales bacterium]|nr:HypC/HybG/HupF family hydrogenase formation chaperone [Candidatus Obscuribacterales bacterium]
MCLAVPGRVEDIFERDGLKMAKVDFCGVKRVTCLVYTPTATVGDYVLVHVGFALNIINEKEAKETYEMLKVMGELGEFS